MNRAWSAFLIVTLAMGAGCTHTRSVVLTGAADWTEAGVGLTLPKGVWIVEKVAQHARLTIFRERSSGGCVALWRLDTPGDPPPWLSLQNLFLDFREKHELMRWTRETQSGHTADCVAYLVGVDGRRVHATGCAVREDLLTVGVVAWGFGADHSASRDVAESVISSVRFNAKTGKKQ